MRSVDCLWTVKGNDKKCREIRVRHGREREKSDRVTSASRLSGIPRALIRLHCSVDARRPRSLTNARSHLYRVYCLPFICATVHIRHHCAPPRQPPTFFRPPRSASLSLRTAASFSVAGLCIRASRSAVPRCLSRTIAYQTTPTHSSSEHSA
jgi:hypothetical protein